MLVHLYLSVCLSVRLSVYLSMCLCVYVSICLPGAWLSVCLSICLSVYLSISIRFRYLDVEDGCTEFEVGHTNEGREASRK